MLTILFVEDHDDTRLGLCRMLSRWGYKVAPAATMSAGLEVAERLKFDVILSDIGLPDGDGYQLIRTLRRQWPTVPAVAFTAFCSDQDRQHAFDAGFNEHLSKPVDIDRLRDVLPPP